MPMCNDDKICNVATSEILQWMQNNKDAPQFNDCGETNLTWIAEFAAWVYGLYENGEIPESVFELAYDAVNT